MHEEFQKQGYLGKGIEDARTEFRAANAEWFALADDTNALMMQAVLSATELAKTDSWSAKAVATRIALRASGNLQGAILMAERGMTVQARILARALTEDAFCIAAIDSSADQFIGMLREDSDASRRLQAKFIDAKNLIDAGEQRGRLMDAITALGRPEILSPKRVAEMGPLTKQYLAYQRLSDDSAHTSAKSINHHVLANEDRTGWCYKIGPATALENASTMHNILLAALPTIIGITQIVGDEETNEAALPLMDRFTGMPAVGVI
jgi:hypothetical protein